MNSGFLNYRYKLGNGEGKLVGIFSIFGIFFHFLVNRIWRSKYQRDLGTGMQW